MQLKVKIWSFFAMGFVTFSLLTSIAALDSGFVIKKVPTSQKVVALTFDDGPHPTTTPALLKVLNDKKVRATFFVLGEKVEQYPTLAANIVSSGHEIASHTYSHRYINRLTKEELDKDLAQTEKAISGVGPKPTLFRPPGGGYNDTRVSQLKQSGYTTVLWSIDPRDWDGRSAGQIVEYVIKKVEPGGIILLHEGQCAEATPAALEIIIDKLREKGYDFATVSELLQYYEIRQ